MDPDLGILLPPETFEAYVRRHCVDHEIYIDAPFVDLRRNLYLWCLHAFHKFCLENPAVSPWPFWEDHEFLANDDFNESDLEMDQPDKAKRRYRIPPLAMRAPGERRRQKKLEKPRETMKTADGFAYATWKHLREYYIEDNTNLRITVHSSTTRLTRKRYINHAHTVWGRTSGELFDLFHGEEEYGPEGRKKTRKIGLIHTRGALNRIDNTIKLRWLQDDPRAFATHSMMGIGADSESTGERSDIYIGDDVQTADNSRTLEMRIEIKRKVADQERQLEHGGLWLWIDTRKYVDDIAGEIDREHREFYWILHRKASWRCPDCGEETYYWPVDGTGKARITEVWLAEQRKKYGTRNFWNELYNEPIDPDKQIFKREWFEIVPFDVNVPLEVRAGLGPITSDEEQLRFEEEVARLAEEGIRIHSICCGDPAGLEKRSKRGDKTAIVGLRLDRTMKPWFTVVKSGQWTGQQQKENALAACVYNKPAVFIWEIVQDSGVEKAWGDFQLEKSRALGHPVLMPMRFEKPRRTVTKFQLIEELEPYFSGGVKIVLSSMCTREDAEELIAQLCGLGVEDHDDLANAPALAINWFKKLPIRREEQREAESIYGVSENGNPTVSLGAVIAQKLARPVKQGTWGRSGGMR